MEKQIAICRCRGERISPGILCEITDFAVKLPVKTTLLSDLCGLAVNQREKLAGLFSGPSMWLIAGCCQRPVRLIIENVAGLTIHENRIQFVNLIESPVQEVTEKMNNFCGSSDNEEPGGLTEISDESGWPSWYPLIDYTRCTSCGQCADFCLFGVYEKTPERISVVNPKECKNQCPACARICPSAAIIFPKYREGGAIGGADNIDEVAELQRRARDIESVPGKDLYEALEKRKLKRKSIIREEMHRKAITEREKFMNGNNKELK